MCVLVGMHMCTCVVVWKCTHACTLVSGREWVLSCAVNEVLRKFQGSEIWQLTENISGLILFIFPFWNHFNNFMKFTVNESRKVFMSHLILSELEGTSSIYLPFLRAISVFSVILLFLFWIFQVSPFCLHSFPSPPTIHFNVNFLFIMCELHVQAQSHRHHYYVIL